MPESEMYVEEQSVAEESAKPDALTPGQLLRAYRENSGRSILSVAKDLRLSQAVVQALESDDYQLINVDAFVRGYLRAYARLLAVPTSQMDAAMSAMQFSADLRPLEGAIFGPPVQVTRRSHRSRAPLFFAVVILIACLAAGVFYYHKHAPVIGPVSKLPTVAASQSRVEDVPLQLAPMPSQKSASKSSVAKKK